MNKQEYWKIREDYEEQMQVLKDKINELNKEYIYECPYKIGDKVLVGHGKNESEVYVSAIYEPGTNTEDDYDYRFTLPKKDGTMGGKGSGIWNGKIIRKL